MIRMGLREARRHFSRAIEAVRRGEDVLLTDRGRSIAVIRPIEPAATDEEEIRRLAAEGILIPAARPGPMAPSRARPLRGEPISATLSRLREDPF